MLGLFVLAITFMMIFVLVKNALSGKQLNADDSYSGTIELIIPITTRSEFYLEPWMKTLEHLQKLSGQLKIHILIDGHHPAVTAWQELSPRLPFVQIHSFVNRPMEANPCAWMIEQIAPSISGSVVIIGDAELVPTEHAFLSLARFVTQKGRAYFVLPQTARINLTGEAISLLNPSLALVSVFGFKKLRRNISHPLMSIAQGWMGMPLETFQQINFKKIDVFSWKLALAREWDISGKLYGLAFGERHLKRYYPEDLKSHINQMKTYWDELWINGDKAGVWLFVAALFVWSFPIIFFPSHPFWSIGSLCLLLLYRFFTKIIFQESWGGVILHPFGALVWMGTFIWWAMTGAKARYTSAPGMNR
jgi:hypothetical protein